MIIFISNNSMMSSDKKIVVKVDLSRDWLDNDFTIYSDGSILHEYDAHPTRPNQIESTSVSKLSVNTINKIKTKISKDKLIELQRLFPAFN